MLIILGMLITGVICISIQHDHDDHEYTIFSCIWPEYLE